MSRRVFVYICTDPDCPPNARAVAHWFLNGKLQVVTAAAAAPEIAADRLRGFLSVEIARNSVAKRERTPEEIAAAQARTAKARATRLARRS